MAIKLYPPYIEGTIPAFYGTEGATASDMGYRLTVPFSMNKGVGLGDIAGFKIRIKNVQSNSIVFEKAVYTTNIETQSIISAGQITFDFTNSDILAGNPPLLIGQFFKVQLAYLNNSQEVGYYSTVGVTKYTTKPTIVIKGLKGNIINSHNFSYIGEYSQTGGDSTEKLYSSKFIIYDNVGNVIEDSGDIIHNVSKDGQIDKAIEEWKYGRSLETNVSYYIQWEVTTSNNLKLSTMKYRIMDKESIAPKINADLIAKLNFDNGYVDLSLRSFLNSEGKAIPSSGLFLLSRRNDDNKGKWEELYRFALFSEIPDRDILFRDYTIEQGVNYTYALQQYNEAGLYSNRIYHYNEDVEGELTSGSLYADFEDAFLYDGKRQLKIRFNPQIATFNRNVQESATPTIGSKYPFIFRNGAVDYKTFPVGGLISYFMDEENLFLSKEEFPFENKTTLLTSDNMAAERIFKMKVYEWLSNGEPKLFRSPSEGNFIVNLMQVSLAANQQLSRMIHSFTGQAQEVATCDYDALNKYGFIKIDEANLNEISWKSVLLAGHDTEIYKWVKQAVIGSRIPNRYYKTIKNSLWGTDLSTQEENANKYFTIGNDGIYITKGFRSQIYQTDAQGRFLRNAEGFLIEEPYGELQQLILKTVMYAAGQLNDAAVLSFQFNDVLPGTVIEVDNNSYVIGGTGTYSQTAGSLPFSKITVPDNARYQGVFTYSYNQSAPSDFDLITNIGMEDIVSRQFIGPVLEETYSAKNGQLCIETTSNIAELIKDVKTEVSGCYNISIYKKEVQPLFVNWDRSTDKEVKNGKYYLDAHCTDEIAESALDRFTIYEIRKQNIEAQNYRGEQLFIDNDINNFCPIVRRGYVNKQNKLITDVISYKFWLNDDEDGMDLAVTKFFSVADVSPINKLEIGNGLIAELSYQAKIIEYTTEYKSDSAASMAKVGYENAKEELQNLYESLSSGTLQDNQIANILLQINTCKHNIDLLYIDLIKALVVDLEKDRSVYAE